MSEGRIVFECDARGADRLTLGSYMGGHGGHGGDDNEGEGPTHPALKAAA